MKNQFQLFSVRRFYPLFITQFIGAFNDNIFKSALVVLITYIAADKLKFPSQILIALSGFLFIMPMFVFSAQAGAVADKFEKAKLIRVVKLFEVLLMLLGTVGFILQNISLLMAVLFLLGVQATLFGPIKYSILPQHLSTDELVAGNGLVEMGTFLAILIGNILGVIFIQLNHGAYIIAGSILTAAILGYLSSCLIPPAKAADPTIKLSFNFIKETLQIIKFTRQDRDVFLCILGISWFWLIGFVFLTTFPNYAKSFLSANENVFVLFLAIFSIGIGVGSSLCNRLLKGQIEATYVPLAGLAITLGMLDLYFASAKEPLTPHASHLLTLKEFLVIPAHWRIVADMLIIAICAGIYIVPLYSIMQFRAVDSHKARVVACNNIMNSFFMTVAALATMGMFKLNFTIPEVFLTVALMNLAVAIYTCCLLPDALVKSILRLLLKLFYKIEVSGSEHFCNAGERVVIAPNHASFLDGLLLAAFLPDKVSFAIYSGYVNKIWLKPIKKIVKIFAVDPTNPYIIKNMMKHVKDGNKLVIFPEGRITVTGALMKIYEGPGLIADKATAKILPVLIEGAQYTPFSRLRGKVRLRWFPKVKITLYPAENIEINPLISGRKRRQIIGDRLYQIMSNILFLGNYLDATLFQGLLDARKIHGFNHKIIEDINRQPLSYQRLIVASLVLGKKLAKVTAKGEVVGLLLPNLCASVVTFFGLQAYTRVAALLNYSTGSLNVMLACETAKIKVVCTARSFIEAAKLELMVVALKEREIKILYLEDLKANISFFEKTQATLASHLPKLFGLIKKPEIAAEPAVILFTSGSEGTPKAVVLSSRNIRANKNQLASRIDFNPADIVLNALPMFHSFGLTAGTILPILYGMKVFFYPSPLHYRIIPEISYDINATILFGTNTFLNGYARYANAYDFYSIRYVFAGAEKLREETRRIWADKFGVRIFEGYGATETSPVISTNTPMHNRPGTVGKFLPGIEYQLAAVPNIYNGGRLSVKGPNIMLGYIYHQQPGIITSVPNEWYDTGDIVSLDFEGYITIQGRAKRFAKVGGEMISLMFVESYLEKLWPDFISAVITQPDEKKGEQLVLITTHPAPLLSEIVHYAKTNGMSELTIPKIIISAEKIPLLASGKTDYIKLKEWLKERNSL